MARDSDENLRARPRGQKQGLSKSNTHRRRATSDLDDGRHDQRPVRDKASSAEKTSCLAKHEYRSLARRWLELDEKFGPAVDFSIGSGRRRQSIA